MPSSEPLTIDRSAALGDQLRRLRQQKGWSLCDLHHAVDRSISVAYLNRIELGGALPRHEKLSTIAAALDGDAQVLARQRDKEALILQGLDAEVAELALTLRALDSKHCRALVGELAATLRASSTRSRGRFVRLLREAIEDARG